MKAKATIRINRSLFKFTYWLQCNAIAVGMYIVLRASDVATYIDHGNVVSIGHHSSVFLHTNMWWWKAIMFLCGFKLINGYLLLTHICKTYNPFRAEEATFLLTVLYILYTVRSYVQLHTIHYHAIITS